MRRAPTIDQLCTKYRRRGLLVDSNLLLVYFVALFDVALVGRFKRTQAFSVEDVNLLGRFIALFAKRVTTPNILSEVSNLSGQLPEEIRGEYFRSFAEHILNLEETYVPSKEASAAPSFIRFGLTDAAVTNVAKNRYLVLTDDFRLSNCLRNDGQDVVNFNHLRQIAWASSMQRGRM